MRKQILNVLMMVAIIAFSGASLYAKDYVIGGGDTLQISVWGSPELSIGTTVRPDGKISIPALGELNASGLTPMELTEVLEKEMKKVVKTPIVTVIVTSMTNYQIYVIGRGGPSGAHKLSRQTTLLEFLSQLGGLGNADLQSAYLVRNKNKIKKGFYELFEKGDFNQDVTLEPNDMLFIPDNFDKRISIIGAVNNPISMPYREGLTINDIILSAGGFNEFANENDVEIYRKKEVAKLGNDRVTTNSGTAIEYEETKDSERVKVSVRVKDLMKGDLTKNIEIEAGDFIVVKERLF